MQFWLEEVKEASKKTISLVLVGNKIDKKEKEVETEEGRNFARQNDMLFFEVSAKTGDNIKELFEQSAAYVLCALGDDLDEDELKVMG